MLQLDETGDAYYYIIGTHPYYHAQPTYWTKPIIYGTVQFRAPQLSQELSEQLVSRNKNVKSMKEEIEQKKNDEDDLKKFTKKLPKKEGKLYPLI